MTTDIINSNELHKVDPVFGQISFDGHEQVVFCNDKDTGLKAIIGIHNTVLGPALGGTRMWKYSNEWEALNDVLRLSRGMSFKSSISGLNLGGGKAVIIGDAKTEKTPELMRKFGQYVDSLSGKYITAEDVGMETKDMDTVREVTKYVTGISESKGGSGNPSPITAYGVFMGMKAAAKHKFGVDNLAGKRVLVQGIGHVGEVLVQHLTNEGAIVTISDINENRLHEVGSKYGAKIFTGKDVKPQIIKNYDGGDIVLNEEKNIILSPSYFKDLLLYKGQTLITTDGTTLLGADDKAGITEIMTAMEFLVQNPQIKHGTLKVCFTPDEEIGRGADHFDVEKFGADWAYTMDGSQIGELEYENFNAAGVKIRFKGKSVHPGYAKGKMINSMLLANKFINKLPKDETPETTKNYEGFYHVTNIQGSIEDTLVQLIIRDHNRKKFEKRKEYVEEVVAKINKKHKKQFGEDIAVLEIKDQYYNMREKVEPVMHIVKLAEQAMKELNIKPLIKPIRGGTDGSRLSFMGLPCPNIFAGGHNFHGKYEYVPVESMQKAIEVIVKIAELNAIQNKK